MEDFADEGALEMLEKAKGQKGLPPKKTNDLKNQENEDPLDFEQNLDD